MNEFRQERVLIVRTGALGDVLHALPAVAALRRAHPEWRIDWAIEPRLGELLVTVDGVGPVVDSIVPVRTREWNKRPVSLETVRDIWGLRSGLRERRYDLCVDMQGLLRSAVVGWMAGSRRYVGAEEPREKAARLFYGERVRLSAAHVIDRGCELLGAAAGETLVAGTVDLPVDAEAEAWADGFVGKVVVIVPGAGWGAKQWPAERFGEVAEWLAEDGWTVLVNADIGGSEKADAVVRASGGRATAVPCTIAQLTSLLRRASLLIGGDTGPMHLADALGVPVVALFGPTDPARTGPRSEKTRVLRHAESRTDHKRHGEAEAGLKEIGVDEVLAAAKELLNEGKE